MPAQTDERPAVVEIPLPPGTVELDGSDCVTVQPAPDPTFVKC